MTFLVCFLLLCDLGVHKQFLPLSFNLLKQLERKIVCAIGNIEAVPWNGNDPSSALMQWLLGICYSSFLSLLGDSLHQKISQVLCWRSLQGCPDLDEYVDA